MAETFRPKLADVNYNRGIAFERQGNPDKAKEEFLAAYNKGLRSSQLRERMEVHGLVNTGDSQDKLQ